ncbi:MAG: molybdate ABC transporter substrate-binding protein [Candidatus Brocadiales bacterium]
MKIQRKVFVIFVLLAVTSLPVMACGGEGEEILVFVAASLTDAMNEIKDTFEERTAARVFLSFASSGTLYRQIEKGAPADVFIPASTTHADALELDGLVLPDTRKDLLTNRLVVIVPKESKLRIEQPEDIARREVKKIAIGEPGSVPAGSYAKEALKNLGLWEDVYSRIVPALDVRAVLAYVEGQAVEAGIVYRTDAMISEEVKVVYEFPGDSHTKIIYPVVILKDSKAEALAREFVDFISSADARGIFEASGFEAIGGS